MSERLARANNQDLVARAWALLLIANAEAAGLCPLSRARFHGTLYLAFAMARSYDVPALSHLVLQDPTGPLYPDVQREVGRLVLSGLVSISDYRPKPRGNKPRCAGTFRLTGRGKDIAFELMLAPLFQLVGKLLSDVSFGLGELDLPTIDAAVRSDPTFSQPGKAAGQIIRFGKTAENRSLQAIKQIRDRLTQVAPASPRDVLATFAQVLQRRAAT